VHPVMRMYQWSLLTPPQHALQPYPQPQLNCNRRYCLSSALTSPLLQPPPVSRCTLMSGCTQTSTPHTSLPCRISNYNQHSGC
jgi:hypothetical protein